MTSETLDPAHGPITGDAWYRAFVQQTLDAVCIYAAETKRILETNPAFQTLLGYTEAEARRLTMFDILAHGPVSVTAYFQEIIGSEQGSRSERQWRRRDGALIDVQLTASTVEHNGQRLVFVLAYDITERKQAEASLRQAEARYRDLFDEAPTMYVITQSRAGAPYIVDCNHEFLRALGYQRADVIGQPLAAFYSQTSQLKLGPAEMLTPGGRSSPEERHLLTRAGQVLEVLVSSAPETALPGQPATLRSMYVDITENKRAEADLRAGALLDDLSRSAASALDFNSTLQLLVDQLGQLTTADEAHLVIWDETQAGPPSTAVYNSGRAAQLQPPAGLAEAMRASGQTLAVSDWPGSPYADAAPTLIRAALGVPLVAGERKLGAALIAFHGPHTFKPEEIARVERAAGPLALAVAKAQLYDQLQSSHAQLTEAYDATLEGWAIALELRDKETEGHTRRVTAVTLKLAQAMGLSGDALVQIRRGALLHDIGKIGIPDDILRKPGPLTEAEQIVMRKHPTYAYEIISAIPFLYPAIDIPYCHHEKWDGTGYPRGLLDEAIPLAARLFAVVDVWDALRSDRPYRPSWAALRVIDHLRLLSGSHFDPQVVTAFLKLLATDPTIDNAPAVG